MKPHTSIQLRIKILSLADETRHIRRWEGRLKRAARHHPAAKETFWSLREHRRGVVSEEARHTLLAFGFLRGLAYKAMEPLRYSDPEWPAIFTMAQRYGNLKTSEDSNALVAAFNAWKAAAGEPAKRHPSNNPPALPAASSPPAQAPSGQSDQSPPAGSVAAESWTGKAARLKKKILG